MGRLRKILRETIPELADALERSWTIALDEWLAAMSPSSDSFNSYPHLRNHEKHLERIWLAYQRHHGASAPPLLSPVEIYVMLSSILFHDIGRTLTSTDHGEASKVIIDNQYPALGIPSESLAKTIARISRFHDLPAHKMEGELPKLSTTAVDPFGAIREDACAALLTLIDHMDGTMTRVVPVYLKSRMDIAPVGAFRRIIRDVEIDLEGQMVKVVLGDDFKPIGEAREDGRPPLGLGQWKITPTYRTVETDDLFDKVTRARMSCPRAPVRPRWAKFEPPEKPLRSLFYQLFGAAPCPKNRLVARQFAFGDPDPPHPSSGDLWKLVKAILGEERAEELRKQIDPTDAFFASKPFDRTYSGYAAKALEDRVKHLRQLAKQHHAWPLDLLLSIILADTLENGTVLGRIRRVLWTMGLPVRAWLLEWRNHLYNAYAQETHEPTFSGPELARTLEAMVKLATQLVGQRGHTYDLLAAELREPSVARAKRMVQRIASASKDHGNNQPAMPLLASDSEWQLIFGEMPNRLQQVRSVADLLKHLDRPEEEKTQ
ncbi:MAG TPA: hypothetical protein VJ801_14935 [Polyangia bacterium]|jgi:hypothetical protein|nr:hypothetical protein [Polyangia bacterium]